MRRVVPLVALMLACGGGTPDARSPSRPLPAYSGHATELFDDSIEARAVGYEVEEGVAPSADVRLRERTQTGDAVVRVHVLTVTSKKEDSGPSWQIGVHVVETVAGSHPPPADFTLQVDATDPAAGILKTFESRLVGMKFVAFLREFAKSDNSGESDLHYHFARDDKDELDAVRSATLLGQVQ